jgi:hypothetical protein
LTIASVIGFGLLMANNASTSARPSSRFLIPQDFTGWVRVEFEVNGAPPLPLENGAYVLRISAAGTLRTSSPEQYGWANDRYCYYSAQGLHSLADSGPSQFIWGKLNAEASGPAGQRKYEEFFVGTGQQFREQSEPHNPSGKR